MKSMHRFSFPLSVTLVLVSAGSASAQKSLDGPLPIEVAGAHLDVAHHGNAAPAVMDFDGDGIRDLLVGEAFNGQLRVYRNFGSNTSPLLEGFTLFQDGRPDGRVPTNYGFCPDTVDLDRDGLIDIITPAWHGQVYWFRQTAPGVFDKRQALRNTEGAVINTEWTFGATSCDWDGDGFPDVIFSQQSDDGQANIYLLRNAGTVGEPRFENPVAVHTGNAPLSINTQAPAPEAVDWNGNGLFDLLIGTTEGAVLLYENVGVVGMPDFGEPKTLIARPAAGDERGGSARPHAVDWNGDGKLDLLLGDSGSKFERELTESEIAARQDAKQSQQAAFRRWAQVYRTYRLLKQNESADRNQAAITSARNELVSLTRRQDLHQLRFQMIADGQQTHGRIWLYLRRLP